MSKEKTAHFGEVPTTRKRGGELVLGKKEGESREAFEKRIQEIFKKKIV